MMDLVQRILFKVITILEQSNGKLYNYFFSNVAIGISLRLNREWEKDQTQEEISRDHKLLLDTDPVSRSPVVHFVPRAWESTSQPLKPNFRYVLTDVHKVRVDTVDFQTKKDIEKDVNRWAEKESKGFLNDFLRDGWICNTTVFMFGSLLDVKGPWDSPFRPVGLQTFYLDDGTSVQAPFMTTKTKQYLGSYALNGMRFKVLKLRYKQGVLDDPTMLIVLPHRKEQFRALRTLIGQTEQWFFDEFNPRELVPVSDVRVPRFRLSFRPAPLEVEGGQFTYTVFTKGVIEMDEMGMRGAGVALSALKPGGGDVPPAPIEAPHVTNVLPPDGKFVADYQFLFFVRDNRNRRMWFNGAVINPNKQD